MCNTAKTLPEANVLCRASPVVHIRTLSNAISSPIFIFYLLVDAFQFCSSGARKPKADTSFVNTLSASLFAIFRCRRWKIRKLSRRDWLFRFRLNFFLNVSHFVDVFLVRFARRMTKTIHNFASFWCRFCNGNMCVDDATNQLKLASDIRLCHILFDAQWQMKIFDDPKHRLLNEILVWS